LPSSDSERREGIMDVIELTKKLVSIQSTTGREHDLAKFISSYLEFNEVNMQEVEGFGPNVIATYIPEPEKPVILLNCHMDTVDVTQGWERDPFTPEVQGNKLYGLGASDMKAGCAIVMDVFNHAVKSEKNVIFTAVSDEEGNSLGSYVLLEKLKKEGLIKDPDNMFCLIPEDSHETVKLGARGRIVIEITAIGKASHGADPTKGTNAIECAAKIIGSLKNLPITTHPKMGSSSTCILKVQGGGDSLSVPDKCTIRVDRHTVPGEDKNQIMSEFDKLLQKQDLKCKYELKFMERKTPFLEPYILEDENKWAKRFLTLYREFYQKEPNVGYGKSVGDFNAFGQLLPTIVFGPAGENAHGFQCLWTIIAHNCFWSCRGERPWA
jgi:acetylornithine deacetylase/succinyl-diaminopimelate desuccinylase-like protein